MSAGILSSTTEWGRLGGVVPNNGTLSEATVRPEGWITGPAGRAPSRPVYGHRLTRGHLETTIVG